MKNKIILNKRKLKRVVSGLKNKGARVVFTNGCFDILHLGHIKYLSLAKRQGDYLIVAVNSDASVRKIKGNKRPITNAKERLEILASLEMVDMVTLFNQTTPLELIKSLRPDIIVKGADWKLDDIVGAKFVKGYGGKISRIAFLKGHSTTKLIKKIAKAKQK